MKFPKITSAQLLLLNALVAIAGATVVGAAQAAYQYYTSAGHVTIYAAIVFGLVYFALHFGVALFSYVPSHIIDSMKALQDTIAQLQSALASAAAQQSVPAATTTPTPVIVVNAGATTKTDDIAQAVKAAVQSATPQVQPIPTLPTSPQQAASSNPVLTFPDNAPQSPDITMRSTISTPVVPQVTFSGNPLDEDTWTGIKAAQFKQGQVTM